MDDNSARAALSLLSQGWSVGLHTLLEDAALLGVKHRILAVNVFLKMKDLQSVPVSGLVPF